MPDVAATLLALLGACSCLWIAYAYLGRWRQKSLLGIPLERTGRRVHGPLVAATRALGRTSPVRDLASRRATVMALLASLAALLGNLMLWSDMAAQTCPWLVTRALPGFAHDLLWHLLWYHASLLFLALWASSMPQPLRHGVNQIVLASLATIPVTLVGAAGAVWLLGTTNLSQLGSHLMGPVPLILLQPLGFAVTLAGLWLAGRRTVSRPGWAASPWADEFQWQHAGAPMAWLHLCEFLQRVYAAGLMAAIFCGGVRLLGSVSFGWFALKTAMLLTGMLWLDARWLSRQTTASTGLLGRLMAVGLGNLALSALVLAWRLVL